MSRSSSGSSHGLHPYVVDGIRLFGLDDWTTSEIKRDKKTGEVKIKIKKVKL